MPPAIRLIAIGPETLAMLDPDSRRFGGRGVATVMAAGDPTARVVCAHTLPENNASGRVLAKNGFAKLGEVVELEDGLVWRWERPARGATGRESSGRPQ